MNKKEKIQFLKSQRRDLDSQEELFKQGLSSITSRKMYLDAELEALGASTSPRKGKHEITNEFRNSIISGLTAGSEYTA